MVGWSGRFALVAIVVVFAQACGGSSVTECTDGKLSEAETDVDCGGVCGIKCTVGQICASGDDCASGVCQDAVCLDGSCADGMLGNDETDIDCGGSCGACTEASFLAVGYGGFASLVKPTGELFRWGQNGSGQLGDGTTDVISTPTEIDAGTSYAASASAVGLSHSCHINADRTLTCWGANYAGQLGNNTMDDSSAGVSPPVTDVRQVAAGWSHSCALTNAGVVHCWGQNDFGQLGDDSNTDRPAPVQVMDDVRKLAAGGYATCAIKNNGDLYCWGNNYYGFTGDGGTGDQDTPFLVGSGYINVALSSHICAIKEGGELYCWGYNSQGQVGNNAMAERVTTPFLVSLPLPVRTVMTAFYHTCAADVEGTAYCWGANFNGQLGINSVADSQLEPTEVANISEVVELSGGYGTTCAIYGKAVTKMACWGQYLFDVTESLVPVDLITF